MFAKNKGCNETSATQKNAKIGKQVLFSSHHFYLIHAELDKNKIEISS